MYKSIKTFSTMKTERKNFLLNMILENGWDPTIEPLLQDDENRFTVFPIKRPDLWDMTQKLFQSFWMVGEVKLHEDLAHWRQLKEKERKTISLILAFFVSSDGIVLENVVTQFLKEMSWIETRSFYSAQAANEVIHAEMYGLLIETYIKDQAEKEKLFGAILNMECVKKKGDWALKWINKDLPLGVRLAAFAFVEGVFFAGSFAIIFWIKKKNILPGLTTSNDFISRDENLHCEFACSLFKYLLNPPSQEKIHAIAKEAVSVEKEFFAEVLSEPLLGINCDSMCKYIEFVVDGWLVKLGYEKLYNTPNPFSFINSISNTYRTNFFERPVVEYKHCISDIKAFDVNEDF